MDEAHQTRAASFGPAAAECDRGRPTYPGDAVPELAGQTSYELQYRTHSFRARVK